MSTSGFTARAYRLTLALAALSAPAFVSQPAVAQSAPYAFIVQRGPDTVAVERVIRSARRLSGEILSPGNRVDYTATLRPGALISSLEITAYAGAATTPHMRVVVALAADSAAIALPGGRVVRARTGPGAMPWLNPAFGLVEQLLHRARELPGVAPTMPLVNVQNAVTMPVTVARIGGDSVVVSFADSQARVRAGDDGSLLGGIVPAQALVIERIDDAAVIARARDAMMRRDARTPRPNP